MNLENGPILLDEGWRDACRDKAKDNHVQGWNGLPGVRNKKKRRFKRPEKIADGDGFIFHKTKQTSYLRQTQFALLPKFPDLCLSRNQFYLLQIPEQLPVEAAVPDEGTRAVDEPVAEIFHFQVESANAADDDQLVATRDPFESDLFNETNAMAPRYLPSPKSIITIPNANLAKSIDRVIRNQMRLGTLELEPFSTEEFKTIIRNRVSMFVRGTVTINGG